MAITVAAPREFASKYIADGSVTIQGFDVQTMWPEGSGASVYTSAFRDPMYDVIVLPLSNFLIAMDKGLPLVGIPVFIDLFFPLLGIRVNKNAGIHSPKDLEGKRVGVCGVAFNPAVGVVPAVSGYVDNFVRNIHPFDYPPERSVFKVEKQGILQHNKKLGARTVWMVTSSH